MIHEKVESMKKLIICLVLLMSVNISFAATSVSSNTKVAVNQYRAGNYTASYQRLRSEVVDNKSNNPYAIYYYGLSAWKVNRIEEARNAMNRLVSMKPKGYLDTYAQRAARCLNNYDACKAGQIQFENSVKAVQEGELDRFIKNSNANFTRDVNTDFEKKHLDVLKYEINSGKQLDDYTFQKYRDYSNNRSQVETPENSVAQARELQYKQALAMLQNLDSESVSRLSNYLPEDAAKEINVSAQRNQMLSSQVNLLLGDEQSNNSNISSMGMGQFSPEVLQTILNSKNTNNNIDR